MQNNMKQEIAMKLSNIIIVFICCSACFGTGFILGYERCKKIMQKIYHKMTDEEVAKYRKLIFGE